MQKRRRVVVLVEAINFNYSYFTMTSENTQTAVLSTEMKFMNKRMDSFENNTNERFDKLEDTIKDFIEAADKKYANKTVEKIVYWMVGAILLAVIGWVLSLVIVG